MNSEIAAILDKSKFGSSKKDGPSALQTEQPSIAAPGVSAASLEVSAPRTDQYRGPSGEIYEVPSFEQWTKEGIEKKPRSWGDTAGDIWRGGTALAAGLGKGLFKVATANRASPLNILAPEDMTPAKVGTSLLEGATQGAAELEMMGRNAIDWGKSLDTTPGTPEAEQEARDRYENSTYQNLYGQRFGAKEFGGQQKLVGADLARQAGIPVSPEAQATLEKNLDPDIALAGNLLLDPTLPASGAIKGISAAVKALRAARAIEDVAKAGKSITQAQKLALEAGITPLNSVAQAPKLKDGYFYREMAEDGGNTVVARSADGKAWEKVADVSEDATKKAVDPLSYIPKNKELNPFAEKIASFSRKPSASVAKLVGAMTRKAGEKLQTGAEKVEKITKGPAGDIAAIAVPAAIGYVANDDNPIAGALFGAAGGAGYGTATRHFNALRPVGLAKKFASGAQRTGNILEVAADASIAGGGPAGFQVAKAGAKTDAARNIANLAALKKGLSKEEIAAINKEAKGTGLSAGLAKIAARGLTEADPMARAALAGAGFGYFAQPEGEGTAAGLGQGLALGLLGMGGRALSTKIHGFTPESRADLARQMLARKTPEKQNEILQAVDNMLEQDLQRIGDDPEAKQRLEYLRQNPEPLIAQLMEMELAGGQFGEVDYHYLPDDQWLAAYNRSVGDHEKLYRPQSGVFIAKPKGGGKPSVFLNTDRNLWLSSPHETLHVMRKIAPNADETAGQATQHAIVQSMTPEQLNGFITQYENLLGSKIPGIRNEKGEIIPEDAYQYIGEELAADAMGQFFENAGPGGVLSYALRTLNKFDDRLASELAQAGSESALFRAEDGSRLKNTPQIEKALANEVIRSFYGVKPKEDTEGERGIVIPAKKLQQLAMEAFDRLQKARMSGNPQAYLDALDAYNAEVESGRFKTIPRNATSIYAEAADRAKAIHGDNPTVDQIQAQIPFVSSQALVGKDGKPMTSGSLPQLISTKERNKRDATVFSQTSEALDAAPTTDENLGMKRIEGADGKDYYSGATVSPEQMNAIAQDPTIPAAIKANLSSFLSARRGQPFSAIYYKVHPGTGNETREARDFSPFSYNLSKKKNLFVRVLDNTNLNRELSSLAGEEITQPGSTSLDPFRKSADDTPDQLVGEFRNGMQALLQNYNLPQPLPGADVLGGGAEGAAKRDAILGTLGIKDYSGKKEPNLFQTSNAFIKSLRLDRMYDVHPLIGEEPATLTYQQAREKMRFMPSVDTDTVKYVRDNELRYDGEMEFGGSRLHMFTDLKEDSPSFGGTFAVEGDLAKGKIEQALKSQQDRFDKGGARFMPNAEDDKNLIAVHNLSQANLKHALKMGGLAVPSMAIIRTDRSKFDNFGDITLVAPSDLIDPKKNRASKVFNADVYSPRYPNIKTELLPASTKAIAKFLEGTDDVRGGGYSDTLDGLYNSVTDNGWQRGAESFAPFMAKYLEEKKIPFKVDPKEDLWNIRTQLRKAIEGSSETGRADFASWIESLPEREGWGAKERIFDGFTNSGNRKYKPHDIENVVKILKRDLQDGEGFNYGVPSIRAKAAKKFKSLESIKKSRDDVIDPESMQKIKDEVDDEFMKLADELLPLREGGKNSGFGALEAFSDDMKAVIDGDWAHLRQMYPGGNEPIQKMQQFIQKIRDLPSEYFESKIQRAVGLHEFAGAIVPKDTPDELVKALNKKGLEVEKYDKGDPASRSTALQKIADSQQRYQGVKFMPLVEDGFYSRLRKGIEESQQKIMSADQAKALVRKSTNAEEIKWTGIEDKIDDMAKESGGKISRDDLIKNLSRDGSVKLRETILENGFTRDEEADAPKYEQYQLPGGANYREIVLTNQPKHHLNGPVKDAEIKWMNARDSAIKDYGPDESKWPLPMKRGVYGLYANFKELDNGNEYQSPHFEGIHNYIAHMRLNDREDSDGNPGLFIEELQSDRGQSIRKEKGTPQEGETPTMPFEKDWSLQMFKRALRDAVSSGKEWIGWTSGETQADRYDLSKKISSISYKPESERLVAADMDGKIAITKQVSPEKLPDFIGKEAAKRLLETELNEHGNHYISGDSLRIGGEGMKGFYDQILPKEVEKYVRKWYAKVEKSSINPTKETTYTSRTLHEGARIIQDDSGYNAYLDEGRDHLGEFDTRETAQNAINEAVRQGSQEIFKKSLGTHHIWKVQITPEMRQSILKMGQPLFMPNADASSIMGEGPTTSVPALSGDTASNQDQDEK